MKAPKKENSEYFPWTINQFLKNPNLSSKAKGILSIMVFDRSGEEWNIPLLSEMTKEGAAALQTALRELTEKGYLIKIRRRDKETKLWTRAYWVWTTIPFDFSISSEIQFTETRQQETTLLENYWQTFPSIKEILP